MRERSNGGIFLVEFLIMLLVFSIASLVALKMFAQSKTYEDTSVYTDRAAAVAESASTEIKLFFETVSNRSDDNESITYRYDDSCSRSDDGGYTASFDGDVETDFISGTITVSYDGEVFATIPVAQYYGGNG